MTLILSLVTHDCAFLVADRRLSTWPDGRIHDDDANKLVFFDCRIGFGYTGLAQLQGKPTDRWLTALLSRKECSGFPSALKAIAKAATDALAGVDRKIRRLAFVGVGWSREEKNIIRPLICRVSNFHADNGDLLPSPSDSFAVNVQFLTHKERFCFLTTGQTVPLKLTDLLTTRMRQFIKNRQSRELPLRLMIKIVRGAAAQPNKNIGLNLLSVCIPKACVAADAQTWRMTTGNSTDDDATFQYWPADLWNGVVHGPNAAIPGGVAIYGFETGSLPRTTESLGGLELHNGKPSRILFPCCLLFNPLTECFVSISQDGGPHHVALFTDEDAVQAILKRMPNQVVRQLVKTRDELCSHLQSIRQVDRVALNPDSPHSKGCLTTSIEGLLSALRSGSI